MLEKIKRWLGRYHEPKADSNPIMYTREEVMKITEQAERIAYNNGKRDGLSIAREQATNSLKEILWQTETANPTNKHK